MTEKNAGADVVVRTLALVSGILAGLGVFGAAAVLLANVYRRQVAGASITGAIELTGLILVVLVTFAIVHAEFRSGHIGITFFVERLPPRVARVVELLGTVIAAGSALLLAWASIPIVQVSIERAQIHSLQLPFRIWPYRAALTVGFTLLGVSLALRLRRTGRRRGSQATV